MPEQAFVARQEQLAELNRRLDLALEGKTQFAFVVGEAGTGKTALLEHFVRAAQKAHPELIMTHGNCNAQTGISDPYLPFREILNLLVGIEDANLSAGSLTEENGKRISSLLVDSGRILLEIGPDLIGSFVPGGALLSALGRAVIVKKRTAERLDQIQKKQESGTDINPAVIEQSHVFEQYTKTLQAIAEKHPLVIIVDDLHWTDKASASLLFHLARRLKDSPALIIGTYRPVEIASGSDNGNKHPMVNVLAELKRLLGENTVDLDHLDKEEKELFFNQLIDSEANDLGKDFRDKFFEITGGHPLFTVELLRHMQVNGDLQRNENDQWVVHKSLDWQSLPVRIDGVIEGRVQRLDKESRDILSAASLQGDQFVAEVVAGVLDMKVSAVIGKLSGELSETQKIVSPRSSEKIAGKRISVYEFQHHLFQQYFLAIVDVVQKAYMHEETGNQLEDMYADQVDELAAELAYHFSAADNAEKAIKYANMAGDRARLAYASTEAVLHYQTALKHLLEIEDFSEAARVTMKVGQSYQNDSDYSAATQAYAEAFKLRKSAGARLPDQFEPAHRAFRMLLLPVSGLDPGATNDTDSGFVITHIFSGLVEIGASAIVVPDGAEKWEILDEGKRYRFHLREDVFWSDGNPVTAHDYDFALRRIFSPELEQNNLSYILQVIKGWEKVARADEIEPGDFGVRVIEDYLLDIELDHPIAYFLQLLGVMVAYPVPQHVVEKHGSHWIDASHIVSNGPFLIKEYEVGKHILLRKNERYHRVFKGNLDAIDVKIVSAGFRATAERKMYADGEIDIASKPTTDPLLYRQFAADLVNGPRLTVIYLGFHTKQSPFNDVALRKALSMAIDKNEIVAGRALGEALPAFGGMVPPGLPGHISKLGDSTNVERARQLLSEAGYPGGENLPRLELTVRGIYGPLGSLLCEQWKKNLDIDVRLKVYPFEEFVDKSNKGEFSVFINGWIADYADPDSFLLSSQWLKEGRWNNKAYLALVHKARGATDQIVRMELYRKAQEIIFEEAPVAPMLYSAWGLFVKPNVKNFQTSVGIEDIILGPDEDQ